MQSRITHVLRRMAIATVTLLMSYSLVAVSPLFAQIQDTTDAPMMDARTDTTGVAQALSEQMNYTQIADALQRTGLDQELDQAAAFTLFAPTDSALESLETPLSEMSESEAADILRNHVVYEEITADQLAQMTEIETGGGEMLQVSPQAGQISIAGATVTEPAVVYTQNGLVHGIDAVLMPTPLGAE